MVRKWGRESYQKGQTMRHRTRQSTPADTVPAAQHPYAALRPLYMGLVFTLLAMLWSSFAQAGDAASRHGLPSEGHPESGIITAAQPTEEQFRELAEAGVKTVINLRTDAEMDDLDFNQRELLASLGMNYYTLPVGSAEDLSAESARAFDELLSQAEGETLVHCASSNRVGALFALRAAHVAGQDVESALQHGKAAGLASLEPAVRAALEGKEADD